MQTCTRCASARRSRRDHWK